MPAAEKSKKNRWGFIACCILAILCLAGSIDTTSKLLRLVQEGRAADAQVVGIETGAKGSKRAVLQFVTDTGSTVVTRDLFQMTIFRFYKGDRVKALYNPSDVSLVTVDIGIWIWLQPVLFFFGFVLLTLLGILFLRF